MRVVAQDHDWFVLEVEPDVGRVFDLDRQRLFAPMSLVAILARGPWHDFDGDPEYVFDALSGAEDVPSDQLSLTRRAIGEGDLMHRIDTTAAVVTEERVRVIDQGRYPRAHETRAHDWPSKVANVIKAFGAAVSDRLRSHSSTSH